LFDQEGRGKFIDVFKTKISNTFIILYHSNNEGSSFSFSGTSHANKMWIPLLVTCELSFGHDR
jgi:lipoprotein signal peptidase